MSDLPITPSFSLAGRRAAVTGAGRGIGLALAAALAEAGADVTLIARSADDLSTAQQRINDRSGGRATAMPLDVSDHAAVTAFFAAQPAFHVLVNNAGTNRPKPLDEVSEADFDAVFDLNVKAAYFVAQACTRRMVEQNVAGSLIHIGSQMGHVGSAARSLYCGSKWAIEGISKAIALDLAPHGIRSNTIAPTFIRTPLTEDYFKDTEFTARVLDKIKLGRLGTVEDLMGAALLLASDASALMTGTSLVVDGGWTAD